MSLPSKVSAQGLGANRSRRRAPRRCRTRTAGSIRRTGRRRIGGVPASWRGCRRPTEAVNAGGVPHASRGPPGASFWWSFGFDTPPQPIEAVNAARDRRLSRGPPGAPTCSSAFCLSRAPACRVAREQSPRETTAEPSYRARELRWRSIPGGGERSEGVASEARAPLILITPRSGKNIFFFRAQPRQPAALPTRESPGCMYRYPLLIGRDKEFQKRFLFAMPEQHAKP